jgi:hypothetical protein
MLSPNFVLFLEPGLVAGSSLRRDEQFANLGHAHTMLTEQMTGHLALRRIFREPERIVH